MIILGLNIFHADTSATLIVNEKIISAIEEERFTKIKHYSGLPINAIEFCLNSSNGFTSSHQKKHVFSSLLILSI